MLPAKRAKVSPSNITEQELNFVRMHIAMGYEPRPNNTKDMESDVIALANSSFPVPSSRSIRL